jgi:hypothetical protein
MREHSGESGHTASPALSLKATTLPALSVRRTVES